MVAENQPGHIDQIKQTNAGAVYRLIDQLGPVSRIDLSRLAQLAPASITKIVREMLEAHLVQELEIKEAGNRGDVYKRQTESSIPTGPNNHPQKINDRNTTNVESPSPCLLYTSSYRCYQNQKCRQHKKRRHLLYLRDEKRLSPLRQ